MAKEYIERDALLKRMEERLVGLRKEYGKYDHYTDGYEEGLVAVEVAASADVVEVELCKECKHFKACEEVEGATWTGFCNYGEIHTDEEDFCSRGERRTDNGNETDN